MIAVNSWQTAEDATASEATRARSLQFDLEMVREALSDEQVWSSDGCHMITDEHAPSNEQVCRSYNHLSIMDQTVRWECGECGKAGTTVLLPPSVLMIEVLPFWQTWRD